MTREWIVVADFSGARIFERTSKTAKPELVFEMPHPEGRMRTQDLVSDHGGQMRVPSVDGVMGMPQGTDPHDVENERFTQKLADHLTTAVHEGKCQSLNIVVGPRLLGALRPHLAKLKKGVVASEIAKDFAHVPTSQLKDKLKDLLA
jgi:protein required for attachment to host cells